MAKYPYSDYHRLNLNWILRKLGEISPKLSEAVTNAANAIEIANGVDAKATAAEGKANTALNAADAALTTAEEAKEIAEQAGTASIPDGGITTVKLADNAVTSAKIADGAVTADDIATGAVTGAKLANLTVTSGKLATSAVTTAKINNNAVTVDKLSTSLQDRLTATEQSVTTIGEQVAGHTQQIATLESGVTAAQQTANTAQSDVATLRAQFAETTNLIYPLGSIYLSVSAANPSTLFGGTWEQIQGRFLVGAGSNGADFTSTAGQTGGEATHTLTANEMPAHTHETSQLIGGTGGINASGLTIQSGYAGSTRDIKQNTNYSTIVSNTGGGAAHNNMPPYLSVYMWKRTA